MRVSPQYLYVCSQNGSYILSTKINTGSRFKKQNQLFNTLINILHDLTFYYSLFSIMKFHKC